jgi:hypothetical protein
MVVSRFFEIHTKIIFSEKDFFGVGLVSRDLDPNGTGGTMRREGRGAEAKAKATKADPSGW